MKDASPSAYSFGAASSFMAVLSGQSVDLDLTSPEGRTAALSKVGLDVEAVWRLAAQEEIAQERDGNTRRAFDAGAFGTPTFVYNGELFFGNDRISMLNDRIREDRPHGTSEAAHLA